MTLQTYTLVHVVISLIGIAAGFVVLYGFLKSNASAFWTWLFLVMTVATDVTGFLFPFHGFLPSYGVGILSMILLGVAIAAFYLIHLRGNWRATYVGSAIAALYLNVFVGVVQSFEKVHALTGLGKVVTGAVQAVVLIAFIWIGIRSVKTFRPDSIARPV